MTPRAVPQSTTANAPVLQWWMMVSPSSINERRRARHALVDLHILIGHAVELPASQNPQLFRILNFQLIPITRNSRSSAQARFTAVGRLNVGGCREPGYLDKDRRSHVLWIAGRQSQSKKPPSPRWQASAADSHILNGFSHGLTGIEETTSSEAANGADR